jgi:hypothetical protein
MQFALSINVSRLFLSLPVFGAIKIIRQKAKAQKCFVWVSNRFKELLWRADDIGWVDCPRSRITVVKFHGKSLVRGSRDGADFRGGRKIDDLIRGLRGFWWFWQEGDFDKELSEKLMKFETESLSGKDRVEMESKLIEDLLEIPEKKLVFDAHV